MTNNWIILGNGDAINLAYVAKVMWGGDFPGADDAKAQRLYIFHAGVAQSSGTKGSITAYNYPTPADAQAARDAILKLLIADGATDFRSQPSAAAKTVNQPVTGTPTLDSYTANPIGSDANASNANKNGSLVTITGTNLAASQVGRLVAQDGSFNVAATYLSSTSLSAPLPAHAAGAVAVDYQYTDNNGTPQTVAAAISITFS